MRDDEGEVGVLSMRLGYQLRRLDLLAMEQLHDDMAKTGMSPARATALVYVDRHPGCDQAALGRVLGINRASTMATVNALVGLGAIERHPGRDRRTNALHLTDEGRRLVAEVIQISADHDAQIFGALNETERADLFRLLVRVREANSVHAPRGIIAKRANLRRVK